MPVQKPALDPAVPYPTVKGIEYVELYVGNVRQAAHYYRTVWGFQPVAFHGLDMGSRDRLSFAMREGNATLLLTGCTESSSEIAAHLQLHGEGVARIAFAVADAEASYEAAVARGAKSVKEPERVCDEKGFIIRSEVMSHEGFSHVLIDRNSYADGLFPGFRALPSAVHFPSTIDDWDHIAIAVECGSLESWVAYYQDVFGFELAHTEDVTTEQTAMNSRVVQHPSGSCRFPLVEAAPGKRRSQVQEFLTFHNGPGVQHLAVRTQSILHAVSRLRNNGVEFLRIPPTYYDELENRVGGLGEELAALRQLGILVDHDEGGHLLQVFAQPCHDRPTMFFEVIERRGAQGFGSANVRSLFEAVEREQALRGTL